MKLCMMSSCHPGNGGGRIEDVFEFTQSMGLEGIDLCLTDGLEASPETLAALCRTYQIKPVCVTLGKPADIDVNAPGNSDERWYERFAGVVRDAQVIGVDKIMIPTPGKVGVDKELTRAKWLGRLGRTVEIASEANVTVCVESYAADAVFSPFLSADDLLVALNEAPGLKIAFDNGNHAFAEDPVEAFEKLADHVIHAHFKDWDPLPPESGEGILAPDGVRYRMSRFGEGTVNHDACLKAMRDAGYEGFINIEYFGPDPLAALSQGKNYLAKLMGNDETR